MKLITTFLLCFTTIISVRPSSVHSENMSKTLDSIVANFGSTTELAYDLNRDGIVNVKDLATVALTMGYIDVRNIQSNYVQIVSTADMTQYEALGYKIVSQYCLPVTKDGVDLFGYVNAVQDMNLVFLDGNDAFNVVGDKLYLTGIAPAVAKVKLKNAYAESGDFYIYGTTDRAIHDYTYDYLVNLVNN